MSTGCGAKKVGREFDGADGYGLSRGSYGGAAPPRCRRGAGGPPPGAGGTGRPGWEPGNPADARPGPPWRGTDAPRGPSEPAGTWKGWPRPRTWIWRAASRRPPTPTVLSRAVAVLLAGAAATTGCPPGVPPEAFARALGEDVLDSISELSGLDSAVAAVPARRADAAAI